MNIGVSVPLPAYLVDVGAMARKAEELGFESFWCAEHPFIPVHTSSPFPGSPDGVIPEEYSHFVDPFVALARASGTTSRIKLATGIVLVPERHPLVLAKEVSTLDLFSGGRFLFGIGAGWLREETQIMGGDFDHRWTQTRESVLAMKELWTKTDAEFHGKYYDFPPVRSYPKPVQKPHPPVLLGGGARNVLQRVVAWGRPRPEARPRGLDFPKMVPMGKLPSPRHYARAVVFLASDDAEMVTGTDLRVDAGAIAKYWPWIPNA